MSVLRLASLHILLCLAAGSGSSLMRKEFASSDTLGSWVLNSAFGLGNWVKQADATVIPESVRQLAIGLFGAQYAERVLAKAVKRDVMFGRETLTLHAYGSDDALQSLPNEFSDNVYGVGSMANEDAIDPLVDIGANLGTFSMAAFKANPKVRILALEPMPITYLFLRWNLEANGVPVLTEDDFVRGKSGVLALNAGATADGRTIDIMYDPQRSEHAVTSASGNEGQIPVRNVPASGRELKKTVKSVNVAKYFEDMGVRRLSFLKINCEGCEHEVVPTMNGLLKGSRHVGAAVHSCAFGQSCSYPQEMVNQTRMSLCELGRCCTPHSATEAVGCFS